MLKPAEVEKQEEKKESKKPKSTTKKEQKVEAKKEVKKYKFPFGMFFNHKEHDVSHVFQDGKEYSTTEISKEMLRHGFYDFSGDATYDHIKDDNMFVVSFKKHAHG